MQNNIKRMNDVYIVFPKSNLSYLFIKIINFHIFVY